MELLYGEGSVEVVDYSVGSSDEDNQQQLTQHL